MLAIAMLLVGAAGASATVRVEINGGTLSVFGSEGDDIPRFDYYAPANPSTDPGITRIFDSGGVVDPLPAQCVRSPDPDPIDQAPEDLALCDDGGTAPLLENLELVLFGGTDGLTLNECFNVVTIDLGGGGSNTARAPACSGGAFNVTGGAGQDSVSADTGSGMNITANLGAGDDTFNGGDGGDVVNGGDGHDYLIGYAGNDQIFGEGGSDDIMGVSGNDVEDGGAGDDRIGYSAGVSHDNDQGGDTLRGGDGSDRLILEDHAGGMTISLDGQANDGAPGEGDNVASDFEQIEGTSSNDVFQGSPGGDKFLGGSGNDEIHGAGGDDNLSGDGGDDRVFGDAGNDKVEGTNGADTVDGGSGADQIYGDIASCSVFCNSDPDLLFARDGERDTVDCGGGADTAQVDQLDVVAFCTVVDRQTVAVPGGPAGPAADPFGLKVAGSARSKALLKRGLTVRLKCPAACKITAELRYKSKKLGSARKTLKKAGAARLVVRISKKAKRTIRRLKKGNLSLRVKVTVAGKTTTLRKTIKFKH